MLNTFLPRQIIKALPLVMKIIRASYRIIITKNDCIATRVQKIDVSIFGKSGQKPGTEKCLLFLAYFQHCYG
jgi:hypothetical protein